MIGQRRIGILRVMLLSFLIGCGKAQVVGAPVWIGVGWHPTNSLAYAIDVQLGQSVLLGPTGFPRINSLAASPSRKFYAISGSTLLIISPVTGNAQTLAPLGSGFQQAVSIRGMAFSPAGVLYAVNNANGDGGVGEDPSHLYTINISTGVATHIGSAGFARVQSLDFAPDGQLFGWDTGQGLLKFNLATGTASKVNPASIGTAEIQTIAFDASGILYGARDSLYSINPATGAFAATSSLGTPDLRGLDFIPEPSAFCLLCLATLAIRTLASSKK